MKLLNFMTIFKVEYIDRGFGPNETIEAVIRNANKDETISGGILKFLMDDFNTVNGFIVPTLGKSYKIPIIKR